MTDSTRDPAHLFITAIIRSLTQHLAQQPAIPALDAADLRTRLAEGGRGYFGQAEASGPDRARIAAAAALANLKRNIRQGNCETRDDNDENGQDGDNLVSVIMD